VEGEDSSIGDGHRLTTAATTAFDLL
jgi:hypothetical protein